MQRVNLDFDGVVNPYTDGWLGEDVITETPVKGAINFIEGCFIAGIQVHICSTRATNTKGKEAIRSYLLDHLNDKKLIEKITISNIKEPAILTIDDRAFHFEGLFPPIKLIKDFKPWNR